MRESNHIGTLVFADILRRVHRGVGSGKILPISEYFYLSLTPDGLMVQATNGVVFITYRNPEITGSMGSCVVEADTLTKIVQRTDTPQIRLRLFQEEANNYLEVKGNGTYKIPILSSDSYPKYEKTFDTSAVPLHLPSLQRMLLEHRACVSKDLLLGIYAGYRFGTNYILTSDLVRICCSTGIFETSPEALVPPRVVSLLLEVTGETVWYRCSEQSVLFETDHFEIYGAQLSGAQDYQNFQDELSADVKGAVVLRTSSFLSALSRMELFTSEMDRNSLTLTFTANGLELSTPLGTETLPYHTITEPAPELNQVDKPYSYAVDVKLLSEILAAIKEESVYVEFTELEVLRLVVQTEVGIQSGRMVYLLSTLDSEDAALPA